MNEITQLLIIVKLRNLKSVKPDVTCFVQHITFFLWHLNGNFTGFIFP